MKKSVVLVDGDTNARDSYRIIIDSSQYFKVIADFETAEQSLSFIKNNNVNIIISELTLTGINGISFVLWVKEHVPNAEIIILSSLLDPDYVFAAFKAGASGFISKSDDYMEFMKSLNEFLKEGAPMSTKVARMIVESFHRSNKNLSGLGKREVEVLDLISHGMTYSLIAEKLGISKETVKSHFRSIYKKLNVNKKSEALAKAKMDRII